MLCFKISYVCYKGNCILFYVLSINKRPAFGNVFGIDNLRLVASAALTHTITQECFKKAPTNFINVCWLIIFG